MPQTKAYTRLSTDLEGTAVTMNRIQFQPGLSVPDFVRQFGSLAATANIRSRWNKAAGLRALSALAVAVCGTACSGRVGAKPFQCNACRHLVSLTSGTLFQSTKLLLSVWFLAVYFVSRPVRVGHKVAARCQLPDSLFNPAEAHDPPCPSETATFSC
jgi:hypothetical protein